MILSRDGDYVRTSLSTYIICEVLIGILVYGNESFREWNSQGMGVSENGNETFASQEWAFQCMGMGRVGGRGM